MFTVNHFPKSFLVEYRLRCKFPTTVFKYTCMSCFPLLQYYNDAMEICKQVYGEFSLLTSRLFINIGIVYEDQNDYVKAFEYFKKWAQVRMWWLLYSNNFVQ